MQEFNRAWRLNQKNIDAYWGAAIVMGDSQKNPRPPQKPKVSVKNR